MAWVSRTGELVSCWAMLFSLDRTQICLDGKNWTNLVMQVQMRMSTVCLHPLVHYKPDLFPCVIIWFYQFCTRKLIGDLLDSIEQADEGYAREVGQEMKHRGDRLIWSVLLAFLIFPICFHRTFGPRAGRVTWRNIFFAPPLKCRFDRITSISSRTSVTHERKHWKPLGTQIPACACGSKPGAHLAIQWHSLKSSICPPKSNEHPSLMH